MLTQEMIAEGWKPWRGGECPIKDLRTVGKVMLACPIKDRRTVGQVMPACDFIFWEMDDLLRLEWRWAGAGCGSGDIIAYRIVTPYGADIPADPTPDIPLMAFGLLSEEQQSVLLAALADGSAEIFTAGGWTATHGNGPAADAFTYRIKPAPALTKPSIDWSHVAPEYRWLAVDDDAEAWLFDAEPEIEGGAWYSDGTDDAIAAAFTSYVPGTCDWRDSLVERPEGV